MPATEKELERIIHMERPWDEATIRRHPRMSPAAKAKVYAPFAALRGHSDMLDGETDKLRRTTRVELSDEEAATLSDKLAQVQSGMGISVVYFLPDKPNGDTGYVCKISGTVASIDAAFRVLKVCTNDQPTGVSIKLDDVMDVAGEGIINYEDVLEQVVEDGWDGES